MNWQEAAPSNQHRLIDLFFRLMPTVSGLAAVVTYLLNTNNQLGGADSGEMITTSYTWGIAHPPGYPLYITLGKLFSLGSPFADIIYTYNLFSTLCSLTAFALLYKGLRLVKINPLAIVTGGCFLIFSPISIRWLTSAEVFSLHLLICAMGIYLTLHTIQAGRLTRTSRWLGLVVGLGAVNHHTILFLFPGFFLVYGVFWLKLPTTRERRTELLWLAVTGLAGFMFYLQPVLSSWLLNPPASVQGITIHSFQDLVDLFLRRLYGTLKLSSQSDHTLPPLYWLNRYIVTGVFSAKGLTLFTGILVVWQVLKTLSRRSRILHWACLIWFLSAISFFLLVDSPPKSGFEEEILARMFLMPNLTATLLAILALDYLFPGAAIPHTRWIRNSMVLVPAATLLVASWNSATQIASGPIDIELQYGRDALNSCSPNSVLLVTADTKIFSTFYLQEVEGFRRDVTLIIWPMIGNAEYHAYLAARFGNKLGLMQPADGSPSVSAGRDNSKKPVHGATTAELILSLLQKKIAVYSLLDLEAIAKNDDQLATDRLTTSLHGIAWRLREKEAGSVSTAEILRDNTPYIESYLEWLPRVDATNEYRTEQHLVSTYINFLRFMRGYQFSIQEQIIPTKLLDKICHLIPSKAPEDSVPSDFYLGLFYTRFEKNPAKATHYLRQFLAQADNLTQYRQWKRIARELLSMFENRALRHEPHPRRNPASPQSFAVVFRSRSARIVSHNSSTLKAERTRANLLSICSPGCNSKTT